MKIFFAWSGPASEQLAEFMREWIPSVIQAARPFMSSQDIRKGQRWANEIGTRLAEADCAILCLTPSNLNSRWIHFEAGAVSRMDRCCVSALLLDVSPTQIEFPLQQFQHTRLIKRDLWQLIQDLNQLCKTPLEDARLRKAFELNYPDVEKELERLRATLAQEQKGEAKPDRSTEAVLADILAVQQSVASTLKNMNARIPSRGARRPARVLTSDRGASGPVSSRLRRGNVICRQLGEILRGYRLARGLTQAMLSSKSDVDRTYIAQLECGLSSPNVSVLCRLSHALQISPTALVTRLEQKLNLGTSNSPARSRTGTSKAYLN